MKFSSLSFLLFTLAFPVISLAEENADDGENLLKNSGLEAVDGVGLPDDWNTTGAANFERKAGTLEIRGAPGAISQSVDLTNFSKRSLRFAIEAKGDARLNVFLTGNYRHSDKTFRKQILSGVVPGPEWKPFRLAFKLDVGGEIEAARIVIEKPEEGDITIRNPRLVLDGLTAAQTLKVVHEERELHYVLHQLENSAIEGEAKEKFRKQLTEALAGCARNDRDSLARLPDWQKTRMAIQEAILKDSAKGRECFVAPAFPFRPLEPDLNPIEAAQSWNVPAAVALSGAPVPFSFLVVNPANDAREWEVRVFVDDKPVEAGLRRQIFMDQWYTKGKTRQADPLTLVPSVEPGVFRLEMAPLEAAQFYIDLPSLFPGKAQVKVVISDQGKPVAASEQDIEILPGQWDPKAVAKFDYLACMAAGVSVFGSSPDEAMQSMEDMGVTAFEWIPIPQVELASDGSITSFDFSSVDPWLERLAKTSMRPAVYWHPRANWKLPDGTPIERHTPQWYNIYMDMVGAFLERAESKGVPRDRIIFWLADEPHSTDIDNKPDEKVRNVVKLLETFRAKYPGIPILTTLTDYALIEDVAAVAPLSDINVPLWRYSDAVLKYSPPDRNSRTEFFTRILPLLKELRENSGNEIWSYFIMSGKSSPVTPYYLAYPVLAERMGLTGVGHWAYSMPQEKSWDDTDGRLPDYQMVYNGKENHPLNTRWNVTKEPVVPSIRWFAMREGLRDARLARTLNEKLASRPDDDPLRLRYEKWRAEITRLGGEDGYGLVMDPKRKDIRFSEDPSAETAWWIARLELQRIYSDYWLEANKGP